ncbi:sentrin/sumo-specific protease, putative, partial [Perkinsus marinus ATCC 50983]
RLNDNLMDFFLSVFVSVFAQNSAYAFSTFFYTQLAQENLQDGWERVKNWTKNVDIFAHDLLLFPINESNQHWWLLAV